MCVWTCVCVFGKKIYTCEVTLVPVNDMKKLYGFTFMLVYFYTNTVCSIYKYCVHKACFCLNADLDILDMILKRICYHDISPILSVYSFIFIFLLLLI